MAAPTATAATTPPPSRELLKLHVLSPSQLPPHPVLAPAQDGTTTDLVSFVTQLLTEGKQFADETIPSSFQRIKTQRAPRNRGGDVEVLSGGKGVDNPRGNDGRGEYWFARRSRHTLLPEGAEEQGQASWEEFVEALYRTHSEKEGEYTPDIYEARKVCEWDGELQGKTVEGWEHIGLEIYEMAHAISFPLNNRVFSTLVLTGRDSASSFISVQVPVDLSKIPAALYSTGKNKVEGVTAQQKKKVVIGRYVSVERCRRVSDGDDAVQWDMATASDAAGVLPMAVQKMALPGVIAKDVEFVMNWAAQRRGRGEPKVTSGGAAS